jgi:uncharacterized membrane protein
MDLAIVIAIAAGCFVAIFASTSGKVRSSKKQEDETKD